MSGTKHYGVLVLADYTGPDQDQDAVAGSHVIRADCGHLSWMSPQGDDFLLHSPLVKTMCMPCVAAKRDMGEGPVHVVPGAYEAVEKSIAQTDGKAAGEAFRRRFGRTFKEYPGD